MRESKTRFSAAQAANIAGLPYHQIDRWDRSGLLEPSIAKSNGHDGLRLYGLLDVVTLRALGQLQSAGLRGEALRSVVAALQGYQSEISGKYLLGAVDCSVRIVVESKLASEIGRGSFAWTLDLGALVQQVESAAANRVQAKRGRASAIA
jgi:DNA-binding transcriptional MerR regulator